MRLRHSGPHKILANLRKRISWLKIRFHNECLLSCVVLFAREQRFVVDDQSVAKYLQQALIELSLIYDLLNTF